MNSYHVVPENSEDILAVTDYDGEFCCMVQHENILLLSSMRKKSGPFGFENHRKLYENRRGGNIMLTKRLLACFDMRDGMVTKPINFKIISILARRKRSPDAFMKIRSTRFCFMILLLAPKKSPLIWKLCEWWQKCVCSFFCWRWHSESR